MCAELKSSLCNIYCRISFSASSASASSPRGRTPEGSPLLRRQGRDQLWWHPMLPGHGVRAEEADMVFDIQMVIVIDQMRRLMSPRASRTC
uniref:Uncharacterized protein n=1 Tax=Aegilops tauschii subsp. strangulata TaxID=200361 RepID=A0A453IHX4_AEGTS